MKAQVTLWGVARRWWWLVLVGVVIASGISYYLTSKQVPLYLSKATVSVGASFHEVNVNPTSLALSRSLAYIYAEYVRRRPITQAVIEARGLDYGPDELAARIQVNVVADAQLLEILVYDPDPLQAAANAEELGRQLVEEQNPLADTDTRRQWLEAQAAAEQRSQALQQQIDAQRQAMLEMTSAAEIAEAQDLINQLETALVDNQAIVVQYAQLTATNPASVVMWVEHPYPNPTPVAPNKTMNVLLGATLGLLVTGGAVVLLEFFDDTLRWRDKGIDEVEGLPTLGVLAPPSRRDPVVTRYRPHSQKAEAVRQLRARIALTRSPHSVRVVLITSPRPKDGKTTTVANLGVASALAGMRTLIIDGDMRHPSLNELFDLPNIVGLADLLTVQPDAREALLNKAIRETGTPHLSLLTTGVARRDPAALLGSPEAATLLALLKTRYDYIVIDTPPVLVAPDAVILAALAEGTVLIARVGRVTRRMMRKAKERLLAPGNVNLLGVAMTGAPITLEGQRSGYRYRYDADEAATGLAGRIYRRLTFLHRLPVGYIWRRRDGTVYFSAAHIAQRLGVRKSTAIQWCKAGRLSGMRKLFRWWVSEGSLKGFLNQELGEEDLPVEARRDGAARTPALVPQPNGSESPRVLPFTDLGALELGPTEKGSPEQPA